ncbi:DJ-1/PfpI family protein [uncultured Sneathiella sp.]|uniref:DJ-1/PfpI family protein n=1 Tax=uncultured Sneathiella sp. TaxID=879315 RepID=UPI002596D1AC|nr:DJ-1/PfpI family protein [uncultured Sneathiella sp.]
MKKIAILTFQGFNEIDSLVAYRMLHWLQKPDWEITICSPEAEVTSMGGLSIRAHSALEDASEADAVMIGSGSLTRQIVEDESIMSRIRLDPARQVIAAQCSGTLMAAKLGLLGGVPACTDSATKQWVLDAGVEVLNQPLVAHGNVATAGGCLGSAYLTGWTIAMLDSLDTASTALHYFAPVGEKDGFLKRAQQNISPYLPESAAGSLMRKPADVA